MSGTTQPTQTGTPTQWTNSMHVDPISLYEWQKPLAQSVVAGLKARRLFISGYPTGSGKTPIALFAAKEVGGPHLVVAPKVALTQWHRMAEAVGNHSQIIGVINPEKIASPNGCEFYTREKLWQLPPNTTVIWDEPHRGASGPKSATTKALAELKAYARGLHAMSATIADTPLKLRALGWWAGMHDFHNASFYGWCRKHGCKDVDLGRGMSAAGRSAFMFTKNKAEGAAIMAQIRRDFGTSFMSLKAEDIPGFPTETVAIKLIDLSERDRNEITEAYESMSLRMRTRAASSMAELGRERERIEYVMADCLAELAAAHIEDGMSTVTFFSFTEPRLRFEAALKERGVTDIMSVYGAQNDVERQAGVDAFQRNEIHAASIMTKAGGAALSLHDERHERPRVSYIVPAYEADLIKQCLGRIRRCAGTHATQFFAIAAGTIQERVAASLHRKLGNLEALNDADLIPQA